MRKAMFLVNVGLAIFCGFFVFVKTIYVIPWVVGWVAEIQTGESARLAIGLLLIATGVFGYAVLNAVAIWKAKFDK